VIWEACLSLFAYGMKLMAWVCRWKPKVDPPPGIYRGSPHDTPFAVRHPNLPAAMGDGGRFATKNSSQIARELFMVVVISGDPTEDTLRDDDGVPVVCAYCGEYLTKTSGPHNHPGVVDHHEQLRKHYRDMRGES
jgi:hypothetical protein